MKGRTQLRMEDFVRMKSSFAWEKKPTLRDATTGFPAKWRLRNQRINSIRVTHQIWVVLLIGWSKFNSRHYQSELGSNTSSVLNFFALFPDVIWGGRNASCFLRLKFLWCIENKIFFYSWCSARTEVSNKAREGGNISFALINRLYKFCSGVKTVPILSLYHTVSTAQFIFRRMFERVPAWTDTFSYRGVRASLFEINSGHQTFKYDIWSVLFFLLFHFSD